MKMNKHEELSFEDLAIVGGGCGKKRSHDHCRSGKGDGNGGGGGLSITININGFAKGAGGCYGSDSSLGDISLPNIPSIPGAEGATDDAASTTPVVDVTTSTSLPGAESTADAAPMDASLGTALPGV